ncbi:MAG TPA: PHB depolymerase family esterase [Kineosporiaceae bacterium]|nr:PHB depolymerase family esterase [Kineosporiaceae bacterium]
MAPLSSVRRLIAVVCAAVATAIITPVALSSSADAASLQQVTNFGTNPTNLEMYVYRPDGLPANPPLLVAVHYCTGSGPAFYSGTQFASLADQYKFIVVYPSSTNADKCFDVSSPAALTRNGGSDPVGIMSMVNYAKQNYGVNAARIYATGTSSGAMMTNVLLGDYPDVFKAGAAFAGVPYTCFATGSATNRWNSDCSAGRITKTAQAWGDLVRTNNSGYTGPWPRMQLWHGTNDEILNYANFGEEIKQWTNVNGLSQTPTRTDTPSSGDTRTQYANSAGTVLVEAHSLAGVTHNLPVNAASAISFFGLDGTGPTTPPTATVAPTTAPPTTAPPTTPPATGGCSASYTTVNSWTGGFVGSVKVTAGSAAINGWTVTLTLPSGTSITNLWNGTRNGSTVTNLSWNGPLKATESTEFGFQGAGSATGLTASACKAS